MTSPDIVFLSGVRTGFGAFGGRSRISPPPTSASSRHGRDRTSAAWARRHRITSCSATSCRPRPTPSTSPATSDSAPDCRSRPPRVTVNRLCGSGFEAIVQGAQQILLGEARRRARRRHRIDEPGAARRAGRALGTPARAAAAAGGHALGGARATRSATSSMARDRGATWPSSTASPRAEVDAVRAPEPAARQGRVGRPARSTTRWCRSPLTDPKTRSSRCRGRATSTCGPTPRREGLAKLPPYFKKDGVVTAGNASGIGDGAAAVVLADARRSPRARPRAARPPGGLGRGRRGARDHGHRPGARRRARRWRGPASRSADMDLVEVNEAFAAQYLAVEQRAGARSASAPTWTAAPWRSGHPLGASGARITAAPAARAPPPRRTLRPRRRLHRRRAGHGRHRGGVPA